MTNNPFICLLICSTQYLEINPFNVFFKLSRPTTIHPIRLPKKRTSIKDNAACFVAGWGATGRRFQTNKLREVDVSTINRKTCEKAWRTKLPANIICAGGYRTKKGFCQVCEFYLA